MSRAIKFRAWDKERNEWFTPFHIDEDGRVLEDHGGGLSVYSEPYGGQARIGLMQYTGLKDKNGKEIWEGDILAGNWVVVWHEAGFYLHIPKLFSDTLYVPMSEKQESEVIGNIHENPELLSEEIK